MVMTKAAIERGIAEHKLKIEVVGPAIGVYNNCPDNTKFRVRPHLNNGKWTIRTIGGRVG